MKKSILNLLLMFALFTFFGSCSSDDEKPDGGSFTWNDEKITLKKGFSANWSPSTEGDDTYYYWNISLTTDGIDFDEEEENMVGTGDLLYIDITGFNVGETELPIGTFDFDYEEGENRLDRAYVFTDYGTPDSDYESFSSGHITISKSGSKYIIEFSLTTYGDETISGTFRGTFSYGYLPV